MILSCTSARQADVASRTICRFSGDRHEIVFVARVVSPLCRRSHVPQLNQPLPRPIKPSTWGSFCAAERMQARMPDVLAESSIPPYKERKLQQLRPLVHSALDSRFGKPERQNHRPGRTLGLAGGYRVPQIPRRSIKGNGNGFARFGPKGPASACSRPPAHPTLPGPIVEASYTMTKDYQCPA